jgi:hypothetical protein
VSRQVDQWKGGCPVAFFIFQNPATLGQGDTSESNPKFSLSQAERRGPHDTEKRFQENFWKFSGFN